MGRRRDALVVGARSAEPRSAFPVEARCLLASGEEGAERPHSVRLPARRPPGVRLHRQLHAGASFAAGGALSVASHPVQADPVLGDGQESVVSGGGT